MRIKKIKISILLFSLFSFFCYAQKVEITEKSISKYYENKKLEPVQVLSRAEQWFTKEENAEDFKIITFNKSEGEMFVEGESKILYKNIGKELYPKRNGMAEVLEASFGNTIKIEAKEDGYSITYEVIDMKKEMYKMEDLFFNCVSFKDLDEENLIEYNKAMNKLLKANLVFKKRRDIFVQNSPIQFEEVNNYLLSDGETTIFSINDAIQSNME